MVWFYIYIWYIIITFGKIQECQLKNYYKKWIQNNGWAHNEYIILAFIYTVIKRYNARKTVFITTIKKNVEINFTRNGAGSK